MYQSGHMIVSLHFSVVIKREGPSRVVDLKICRFVHSISTQLHYQYLDASATRLLLYPRENFAFSFSEGGRS
jgi:hypothetical protein